MKGRLISVSVTEESSHLGLLGGLLEALQTILSLERSIPLVLLELLDEPVDDDLVEIVPAEVGVAVGGLDLDDVVADLEDGDVEGPAAEIEDGDRLVLLLVEAVGQGRRRRLVDDPLDGPAGDLCRRPWWPGAGRR